jgi:hypothetical protein
MKSTPVSAQRAVVSLTSPASAVDPTAVEDFAGRIAHPCTGTALTFMIELGRRTGLFEAAARGPATSNDLTDQVLPLAPGLPERLRAGARRPAGPPVPPLSGQELTSDAV